MRDWKFISSIIKGVLDIVGILTVFLFIIFSAGSIFVYVQKSFGQGPAALLTIAAMLIGTGILEGIKQINEL